MVRLLKGKKEIFFANFLPRIIKNNIHFSFSIQFCKFHKNQLKIYRGAAEVGTNADRAVTQLQYRR